MAGDILWERHSAVFRFLLDKAFFIGNHKLILLFCRAVMRIAQHRILQRCSQSITAWLKGNECDASADHAPNKGNVFLVGLSNILDNELNGGKPMEGSHR